MMLSHEQRVRAIVNTLILRDLGEEDIERRTAIVSDFVLTTQRGMPDFAGLGIRFLTLLFDMCAIPASMRRFHNSALPVRLKQIDTWQSSRLGFLRSTISFYETLTVFGIYSDIYGKEH
jgi:hypothetical protein